MTSNQHLYFSNAQLVGLSEAMPYNFECAFLKHIVHTFPRMLLKVDDSGDMYFPNQNLDGISTAFQITPYISWAMFAVGCESDQRPGVRFFFVRV